MTNNRERREVSRRRRRRATTQGLFQGLGNHESCDEVRAPNVGNKHRRLWSSQLQVRKRQQRRMVSNRLLTPQAGADLLSNGRVRTSPRPAQATGKAQDPKRVTVCQEA